MLNFPRDEKTKSPPRVSDRSHSYKFPCMASNDDPMMGSLIVTGLFAMPPLAQWFRLLLFNYIDMLYPCEKSCKDVLIAVLITNHGSFIIFYIYPQKLGL